MKKNRFIALLILNTLLLTSCINGEIKREQTRKQTLFQLISKQDEKIKVNECEDLNLPVVENDQYLFFVTLDKEIVRINKSNGNSEIIHTLKKDKYDTSENVVLELSKNKLYYIYDGCLYQSDLNGQNVCQIISIAKLKKVLNDVTFELEGIKIYNNNIYLAGSLEVLKLDTTKDKIQVVASDVRSKPCFYQGAFYYYTRENTTIREVNLETLKEKKIRRGDKQQGIEKKIHYTELMVIKGKLYFEKYQGKGKVELIMYKENGKDKRICNLKDVMIPLNSDDTLLYKVKADEKDQATIELYDFAKKTKQEINLQENIDLNYEVMLIGNSLVYSKSERDGNRREYYEVKKII